MQSKISNVTSTPITTVVPVISRVTLHTNGNTRQTRSMMPKFLQIPQLSTPSLPKVDHSTQKNIDTEPKNMKLSYTRQHQHTIKDCANRQPEHRAEQEHAINQQKQKESHRQDVHQR